jgi:hypothetical protein
MVNIKAKYISRHFRQTSMNTSKHLICTYVNKSTNNPKPDGGRVGEEIYSKKKADLQKHLDHSINTAPKITLSFNTYFYRNIEKYS